MRFKNCIYILKGARGAVAREYSAAGAYVRIAQDIEAVGPYYKCGFGVFYGFVNFIFCARRPKRGVESFVVDVI